MAPPRSTRKRKDIQESEVSEDELNGTILDGVLSDTSEDEAEVEDVSGSEDPDSDDFDDPDDDELGAEHGDATSISSHNDDDDDDKPNYKVVVDPNGKERYVYEEIDPVYDSDDTDAQELPNTIGDIPLSFYDSYPHIGYDINGKKIMRPATGEALDALLDSIEIPKGWTGLTDPQTGKPLDLTQDQLELLSRLQRGVVPDVDYDPYPVSDLCPTVANSAADLLRNWCPTLLVSRRRCPSALHPNPSDVSCLLSTRPSASPSSSERSRRGGSCLISLLRSARRRRTR